MKKTLTLIAVVIAIVVLLYVCIPNRGEENRTPTTTNIGTIYWESKTTGKTGHGTAPVSYSKEKCASANLQYPEIKHWVE